MRFSPETTKTRASASSPSTMVSTATSRGDNDFTPFLNTMNEMAAAATRGTDNTLSRTRKRGSCPPSEENHLIKKLHEGNASGKIPDKHFNRLLAEYDTEQDALEQEAAGLKESIATNSHFIGKLKIPPRRAHFYTWSA